MNRHPLIDIQLIEQSSKRRLCVLNFADKPDVVPGFGTGTLLMHRGDLFVLTCEHVASPFLSAPVAEVAIMNPSQKVGRPDVESLYQDEASDLAILRIGRRRANALAGVRPLVLADLGNESDYCRAQPDASSQYCIIGFPDQVRQVDQRRSEIRMTPLVVTTEVLEHDQDRLVLDYMHGIHQGEVLQPDGISGALVYEIPVVKKEELWMPPVAVASVHSLKPYYMQLLCSPIHQLRALLE